MRQGALATGGRNHYVGLTALDNGPIMTFPAEARLDLLCVGHLNIDHEVRVAELPKEDRTVPTLTHDIFLGGTAANVARWGARTGLRCGLAAFVGRDLPEYMRETLRHDRVDISGVVAREGVLTPTCWIALDRKAHQQTFIDQGAMARTGRLALPDLQGVGWVHITTGDPEYQLRVARKARSLGINVAADPAQEIHYRWNARRLHELLSLSEILFVNRSELTKTLELAERRTPEDLLGEVPLIVETLGSQGARAYTRRGTFSVPAKSVRHPQTVTGAGDAFRGGFYGGWLRGLSIEKCLRAGTAAGALVVANRRSLFLPIKSRSS